MRLIDRYIAVTVAWSTAGVIAVLLSLVSFGGFIDELNKVGHGHYGLAQAVEYVILSLPRTAYELFPSGVLLGSLLGLGMMAGHKELVAIRASGVSLLRIVWAVLKVGLMLMAVAVAIGEYLAPACEQVAQGLRTSAMTDKVTLNTRTGLWMRDNQNIINIRTVLLDGHVGNVTIYRIDGDYGLRSTIHARSAVYHDHQWTLKDVSRSLISSSGVSSSHEDHATWKSLLNPELFDVVSVEPHDLSTSGLYRYIAYLKANGLDARRYQLAFWQKLMWPFAIGAMLLISIPFVMGPLRLSSMGQRILVGVLLGMGFHLVNQALGQSALFYHLNLVFCTTLPTLSILSLAVYLIYRAR